MPTRTTAAFTTGESPAASKMNADAKGWVASETMTTAVSGIAGTETTISALSSSPPLIANRRYLILAYLQIVCATSDSIARVRIKEDGTVIGLGHILLPPTTGYAISLVVQTQTTTTADVTRAYTVTVERMLGSGTFSVDGTQSGSPNRFQIIDVGPST